ncbi:MAG: ATP-binding cassette domain-containing protein [Chitinophagaceae bacterium]|nr:MAG: ATP-binding cassette domain-containing protein [Chitinophagaceae bacterium]
MNSILSLQEVSKIYGNEKILHNISLEVPEGNLFGLLGPNGAGKTTLIRIITDIIGADAGRVFIKGIENPKNRQTLIGYMPEERGLYRKMKVGEHLIYLARLKGLSSKVAKERIHFWLEKFEIEQWWKKKIEELSKGMQQKIQFIATVVHDPEILILDEPFSGLDPVNASLIRKEIFELKDKGKTIIFSTHRMEQVEEICEKIALIHKGEKVLEGKVSDIKESFKENIYKLEFDSENLPAVSENDVYEVINQNHNTVVVKMPADKTSNELIRFYLDRGMGIKSFNEILPTINEIFIKKVTEN